MFHGGTPLSCCATIFRPDLERTSRFDGDGNMAADVCDQEDSDIVIKLPTRRLDHPETVDTQDISRQQDSLTHLWL